MGSRGGKEEDDGWLSCNEEIDGEFHTPVRKKRKYRKRKLVYDGWGSTSLIEFLKSIGRDPSNKMTQSEVADIVLRYAKQNDLFLQVSKKKAKKIVCDQKLNSLFRKKSINRLSVNKLLESHFAENREESSSDDILSNSEDDDDDNSTLATRKTRKMKESKRTSQLKKPLMEIPRSCFAAIMPSNINLVYLKKSLVEDLLKDPETFETKVVGSFVRCGRDTKDYRQKNPYMLLQVRGIEKSSGVNGEILLKVSGFIEDMNISINMLSDDNFSEEECKDLHQRVKNGWLKRPMVVDIEQKARELHGDITKHWIPRELTRLKILTDRANVLGLRRELFEYLEEKKKLQSPDIVERLLHEIPGVIADDLEPECTTPDGFLSKATKLDIADLVNQESISPKSILSLGRASESPHFNMSMNGTMLNCISRDTAAGHQRSGMAPQLQPERQTHSACKKEHQRPSQVDVIELSDDEDEEPSVTKQVPGENLESLKWYYTDPQGCVQGPFPLTCLKRWFDSSYFSPDFKVWESGQSQEGVLLGDVLTQYFPS